MIALDRLEGEIDMRGVVHRQHDAGDDLHAEHEREDAAEGPPVVQVPRRRVGDERGVNQAADRQPLLKPLQNFALRLVGRISAHGRTFECARFGSADLNLGVGYEFVRRQGQVLRRRTFADAAGGVVLRAVAGQNQPSILALMGERDAAEMGADADDDQPLLVALLDAGAVGLRDPAGSRRRPSGRLRSLSWCDGR